VRIVALLCALSWVAVRAVLVCGYPASKGGILRAISPAGRRVRASALVSGRKNHDVYIHFCAIHVHLYSSLRFRRLLGLSRGYNFYKVCGSEASPSMIVIASWKLPSDSSMGCSSPDHIELDASSPGHQQRDGPVEGLHFSGPQFR
jgi:hypothetical protein